MRRRVPRDKTKLYRYFSAGGELLYIGISVCALRRLEQHGGATWIDDVRRVEIQNFTSRTEAVHAEGVAIKAEKPKYNKKHTLPPGPLYNPKRLAEVNLLRAIFEKGPIDAFGNEVANV